MKTYLVGGAVRDAQMGFEPEDRDYLVVGATPEDMLALGYHQVGADFPVFHHPETHEEYALARQERKTGSGYMGFEVEAGPEVTVEQDLSRRDLTINAMALDLGAEKDGLIDPYGGADDIKNRVLRHTSEAFAEDPVRVLRLARLRARYGAKWSVAPETRDLCARMAREGALDELKGDRIWKELSRALGETSPRLFFDTLLEVGALRAIFPEVDDLRELPEKLKWHPEGNTYEHTMLVLEAARRLSNDLRVLFPALCHDFGKALTPVEKRPSYVLHDVLGVERVAEFADRVRVPSKVKKAAVVGCRYHMHMHNFQDMRASKLARMFKKMGAFSDPELVDLLVLLGKADARGRLGSHDRDVSHLEALSDLFEAANAVQFQDAVAKFCPRKPPVGLAAADLMDKARGEAIKKVQREGGQATLFGVAPG
jgi:tRNA nucleotidyltransferase (CCA-adding enzyme)